MAAPLVPDDLWVAIQPLLPPEPLKRKGGRHPLRAADGHSVARRAHGDGLQREDLLETGVGPWSRTGIRLPL